MNQLKSRSPNLKQTRKSGWTHTVLHDFSETEGDGSFASLVIDAKGNLYGATSGGGTHNAGTVFEIVR